MEAYHLKDWQKYTLSDSLKISHQLLGTAMCSIPVFKSNVAPGEA